MNESPLPRLTVSREEAKEKIQERITRGEELLDTLETSIDEYDADLVDECSQWSQYNENLLMTLFSEGLGSDSYNPFPSRGGLIYVPKHLLTLHRIKKSINSLQGIYGQLDLYPEYSESTNTTQHSLGKDVFIVHGRDDGAKETVARFVEGLGMNAIILHEQPSRGETIIEKIERYSDSAGFAIVLITPDDVGGLESEADDEQNPRARQNVVFELGYFMGKLGRERVCPLFKGEVENPSDIDGIVYIDMDPRGAWKAELQREMGAVIQEIPSE